MANNSQEIVAAVSPQSVGGLSLFEAGPITAENVREFYSEADVIAAASRELEQRGFTVLAKGPVTISIAGSRELFQEVFGVTLHEEKATIMEGQDASFLAPADEEADKLLHVPEELSDLIEGVAISFPPQLCESPLPPIVAPDPAAYRYLFVPDDIGVVLRAVRVHRLGSTGKGVKVAMVDTGFYRHPFYGWHGYDVENTVLGPGATGPSVDLIGHGTGEAANIFAAAPDIELTPVKDMFNLGPSDIKGAFDAAVAQSPHIITNSWGYMIEPITWAQLKAANLALYNYLKTLEASVANAVASGIVVCFAAGNRGDKGFPASHPDVIAVGGVHVNYPFEDPLTNYLEASTYASSFDSKLYSGRHVPDLCGLVGEETATGRAPLIMLPVQPGAGLDTPDTGSANDGWGLFSGTSAACPQVAGVAALLLEKDPTLTPAQVKQKLIRSAMDVKTGTSATGDSAGPGTDAATGAGLVDAKFGWLITTADVAAQFVEASPEVQAEMLATGQIPRAPRAFVADLLTALRSR